MVTCGYCSYKTERRWNFCPKCGNKLRGDFKFNDLINKQMDYLKKMLNITEYDISIEPQTDNTFVINISHDLRKNSFSTNDEELSSYRPKKKNIQMKLPKKTIEPEVIVKKRNNDILLEVELPGIKREKEVELTRLSNSIELRSTNGKLGYFKILKIPSKYRLIEKRIEKNKLFLKFS